MYSVDSVSLGEPPDPIPGAVTRIERELTLLWSYRALCRNLVSQELRIRYRNSVLGFVWSLIHPILMMAVFTFVFTVVLQSTPSLEVPYPLFVLTGILPWTFLATSFNAGLASVVGNAHVVTRIKFPYAVLPLSTLAAAGLNFVIAECILAVTVVILGYPVTLHWLVLPVVLVVQVTLLAGICLIGATANVFFRDTTIFADVLLQVWFFLTPVIYTLDQVNRRMVAGIDVQHLILILNPMAEIVAFYRASMLGVEVLDWCWLIWAICVSFGTLVSGLVLFTHYSSKFGEML